MIDGAVEMIPKADAVAEASQAFWFGYSWGVIAALVAVAIGAGILMIHRR